MPSSQPVSVWHLHAALGEGPVWVSRDAALWFTDIKSHKVHRFDPITGGGRSWDAPAQIGFIHPAAGGGFVVGLQSGLHHFDEAGGTFSALHPVEPHLPGNRLNDATVDDRGRLWFGTMDDAQTKRSGAFYRFEAGRVSHTGIGDIVITNGPALSPDGRTLYHVDTLARTIDASDVAEDGSVSNTRPFVRIAKGDGNPDGPTVDRQGYVWIGLYGGWAARRYSPAGELVETVRFPVANITKLAFGGADGRTVYATTARQQLTPEELQQQPEAGDLFAFRTDVPGPPGLHVAL